MGNLQMLDVAIGITFVFLLLSLICTAFGELLESRLKIRAKFLEKGISELLQEPLPENRPKPTDAKPTDPKPTDPKPASLITENLYQHPVIFGLFEGDYVSQRRNLPSYIPARLFAQALMDLTASGTLDNKDAGEEASFAFPSGPSIESLKLGINQIQHNPKLKKALYVLVRTAGDDLNRVQENIEHWYNSAMDRVSGRYKRHTQRVALLIGFGIACFTNADTIAIFKSLTESPALRQSVVTAAQQNQAGSLQELETRIDLNQKKLEELSLPIGWDWRSRLNDDPEAVPNLLAIPNTFGGWVLKVIGWIITTAAVSLGAPFWFDLLNKFMVIRATVKPREKSQDEASEDRQMVPKNAAPAGGQPGGGQPAHGFEKAPPAFTPTPKSFTESAPATNLPHLWDFSINRSEPPAFKPE